MGKGSGADVRPSMIQGSLFAPDGGEFGDDAGRPEWVTDEVLARMLESHKESSRPRGAAGGTRHRYSPTQLEKYMRCPYGWFIEYIADTEVPRGPRTRTGTNAHQLIDVADASGLDAAKELLERVPPDEREWVWGMVERAWETYSKEWPESERHRERTMTLRLESGHEITGRADRVDVFDDGVLVIDWKLNCTTKPTTAEYRARQTQRFLYPAMAAQTFDRAPLGMIYVSLQQGKHEGSTTRDLGLGGEIDFGWEAEHEAAMERVGEALAAVERGDWWRRGEKCPSWCSCHAADAARERWTAEPAA